MALGLKVTVPNAANTGVGGTIMDTTTRTGRVVTAITVNKNSNGSYTLPSTAGAGEVFVFFSEYDHDILPDVTISGSVVSWSFRSNADYQFYYSTSYRMLIGIL